MTKSLDRKSRILGGLYGSLVGDALGVPVEFAPRSAREADPVTGMREFGTHNQPAGTWSDDGSLLLCSVESQVKKGYETQDMAERFVRWEREGLWAAHGKVFDIGNATYRSLNRIEEGVPAEKAGGREDYDNGNGSLMRILPVALGSLDEDDETFCDRIERASAITHGHARSKMACVFHGLVVRGLMAGSAPAKALQLARSQFADRYAGHEEIDFFQRLLNDDLENLPPSEIVSGGYVIDTLTASLCCLLTEDNFSDCVLKAVNLGSDTDTTGCVAGGLAGVYWGVEAIPQEWRAELPRQDDLRALFARFVDQVSDNG